MPYTFLVWIMSTLVGMAGTEQPSVYVINITTVRRSERYTSLPARLERILKLNVAHLSHSPSTRSPNTLMHSPRLSKSLKMPSHSQTKFTNSHFHFLIILEWLRSKRPEVRSASCVRNASVWVCLVVLKGHISCHIICLGR